VTRRKRRGHDEGGIRQLHNRKAETWEISVTLPPDPRTGERKRATRTVRGSRDQARDALIQWQADIIKGDHVPPDRMTVAQLADRWLHDEAGPRVRATTLALYADTIRVHIVPKLGTVRVQALAPADVHQWMARLGRVGIGAQARQMALARLKQMLDWAVKIELVTRNVAAAVKPPRHEAEPGRAMGHAELRAFLTAARSDGLWPLWLVYATTGMRRGEALGLRWSDLDTSPHRLHVARQVVIAAGPDGESGPRFEGLKTRASRRVIDIDRVTANALAKHREAQEGVRERAVFWGGDDLIFCTAYGTPIRPDAIYKPFRRICVEAGLDPKEWTVHALRHSHASHLLLAGVPLIEVSQRLGHQSVAITASLYAHMISDYDGKAAAAIEAGLLPEKRAAANGDDATGDRDGA
jgi:integrase